MTKEIKFIQMRIIEQLIQYIWNYLFRMLRPSLYAPHQIINIFILRLLLRWQPVCAASTF